MPTSRTMQAAYLRSCHGGAARARFMCSATRASSGASGGLAVTILKRFVAPAPCRAHALAASFGSVSLVAVRCSIASRTRILRIARRACCFGIVKQRACARPRRVFWSTCTLKPRAWSRLSRPARRTTCHQAQRACRLCVSRHKRLLVTTRERGAAAATAGRSSPPQCSPCQVSSARAKWARS